MGVIILEKYFLFLFFIISLLPTGLQAVPIYHRQDPQDHAIYTDQPIGAKVTLGAPLTLQNSKTNKTTSEPTKTSAISYQVFSIVKPTPQQTIRNNHGQVSVRVNILPSLQGDDRIHWLIDDKAVAETAGTQTTLKNIDRGTHTLQAKLYNKTKQLLMSSNQVVFYLHRPFISKTSSLKSSQQM